MEQLCAFLNAVLGFGSNPILRVLKLASKNNRMPETNCVSAGKPSVPSSNFKQRATVLMV